MLQPQKISPHICSFRAYPPPMHTCALELAGAILKENQRNSDQWNVMKLSSTFCFLLYRIKAIQWSFARSTKWYRRIWLLRSKLVRKRKVSDKGVMLTLTLHISMLIVKLPRDSICTMFYSSYTCRISNLLACNPFAILLQFLLHHFPILWYNISIIRS